MAETLSKRHQSRSTAPKRQRAEGRSARGRLLEGTSIRELQVELAGIRTAILESGEGPPLVLLHGPGEHAPTWCDVIEELAPAYRVLAPDLPGHGASESGDGPLDAGRILAWLDALVGECCEVPPVLVGHLVGGAIAARYAIRHEDRIRRLVLVDSLGLAPFEPDPGFGRALQAYVADPTEEAHDHLWHTCAFDVDGMRRRMGDRWDALKAYSLDRIRRPDVKAAMGSLMESFGYPPIPSVELERIATPTVLIWGREDLATDVRVAEEASGRFGWPLVVIDAAAADLPLERPQALVEALRSALDREELRAAWTAIASGYGEFVTPSHRHLSEEALERAELRAGMRFLDVAAGTGALSIPASRLGAQVTATDISPAMLDELATRAGSEGLEVETRVMDGHALELEDDTFDVAGSQFGVMLFEDAPRAIREMTRVVKPGGRVLLNVFGDPREVDFLGFFFTAVRSVRPHFQGLPSDPPPLPFQFQDPDRLRAVMETAGLRDVRITSITETTEHPDGDHLWGWLLNSNPIPGMILSELGLTDEERARIRDTLSDLVRRRADGGGAARLSSPVHIAIGTK